MTWTHVVQEALENGATNIFRSLVRVNIADNAMIAGTTVEVVVGRKDLREMMVTVAQVSKAVAQATKVVAQVTKAVQAVAQATKVVAQVTKAVEAVAQATMVMDVAVTFQCLTNFELVDVEVVEVVLVVEPNIDGYEWNL